MHWRAEFFLLDLERCRSNIAINDTLNKQAVWLTDAHPDYLIMGVQAFQFQGDSEYKIEDVIPPSKSGRYEDPQEHVKVQDHAVEVDDNLVPEPENANMLNPQQMEAAQEN